MSVIPQDPYLFNDTIRSNIDPLNEKSDQEIIDILKEVKMWKKMSKFGGLNFLVEKRGRNFS